LGFGFWELGIGVWGPPAITAYDASLLTDASGATTQRLGFEFGVWGLGFRVWGLIFGVQGLGFGVWGLEIGV